MDQGPRYLKPGWLTSRGLNPLLMRLGVVSTLAVRGRVSGEWRTVPVNVLELEVSVISWRPGETRSGSGTYE
jgi:hypothetical protein